MPVYEYKCLDCEQLYDIFHLSKEKAEDIVCPNCSSTRAKKLISTFSATTNGNNSTSKAETVNPPSACGINGCCFN